MPLWMTSTVLFLTFLITCGVAWRTVFRPMIRGIGQIDTAMPVLVEIAKQFHPDNGTTLRDVVNRLEESDRVQTVQLAAQTLQLVELDSKINKLTKESP